MESLTPQQVRERAALALITMSDLFKRARVDQTTFWRWERGEHDARLLTKAKLARALEAFEKESVDVV